jgi:hypothetical protein
MVTGFTASPIGKRANPAYKLALLRVRVSPHSGPKSESLQYAPSPGDITIVVPTSPLNPMNV